MSAMGQNARDQTREVTARLESLSCMALGISHAFNNMLAAVLANAEAIQGKLAGDDAIRPYVDRIESNTRKAIALTKRIQTITEDGATECETVYLAAFVDKITKAISRDVPDTCSLCVGELETACVINVIPELARASITAIIRNAIESLPDDRGQVHVRVCRMIPPETEGNSVALGETPTGPCNMLEIRDTGSGIAPGDLNRMFDPFFTTHLRAPGLGLVSIVGLIHSCQTAIQVQSRLGDGTTIRLFFHEQP